MKTVIVGVLVALVMSGCATERVMSTGKQYPPTVTATVKIYQTEKPSASYEEIGRVSVDKYTVIGSSRSGDVVYNLLREKAASIGGDAIIGITEDFASISGVVIKMKSETK
jgi:hypothetical protein